MGAHRVGNGRLDGVGVGYGDDGLAGVLGYEGGDGAGDALLHLGERLAIREAEAAGVALHRCPLGQLEQVFEQAAGPVAEVAFE